MNAGDRVMVNDPALEELRNIFVAWNPGKAAKPNHHGTIDRIDGDEAIITFDDGGCAPYPLSAVRLLGGNR